MPLLEKYGFYALILGAGLVLIGYTWLVVRAFKFRRLWGFVALFPPLAQVTLFGPRTPIE